MEGILKRQNEMQMLKTQYVARYYLNRARILDCLSVVMLVLPAVLLLPIFEKIPIEADLLTLILDSVAIILGILAKRAKEKGDCLRASFDSYVLQINCGDPQKMRGKNIDEVIYRIIRRFPKRFEKASERTGKDSPPGVRDWYEDKAVETEAGAILECQTQNVWWTEKAKRFKDIMVVVWFLVAIVAFGLTVAVSSLGVHKVFIAFLGVVVKLAERAIVYYRCSVLLNKILGAKEIIEHNPTKEQVKELQCWISEWRMMPVTYSSFWHKVMGPIYTKIYRETHSGL